MDVQIITIKRVTASAIMLMYAHEQMSGRQYPTGSVQEKGYARRDTYPPYDIET
ncbi:MAG TPA: hypothetical protein VNW52_09700 [Burkholderiaceae bacterium]|jgi:hypothetical protein|nr:hypothetical protein [Burkholderiaceae bacterium]